MASGCRYPPPFEPWWTDCLLLLKPDFDVNSVCMSMLAIQPTLSIFHEEMDDKLYIYIYIYHFVDVGGKLCHFKVQLQCNYLARQQGITFKSFKFPFLDPFFVKTKALSRFKTVFHINFSFKIYKIYILSLMS